MSSASARSASWSPRCSRPTAAPRTFGPTSPSKASPPRCRCPSTITELDDGSIRISGETKVDRAQFDLGWNKFGMIGAGGDGGGGSHLCAGARVRPARPSSIWTVPASTVALRILVYSDNAETRERVMRALGKRLHPDLPELSYVEVATGPMVMRTMDAGRHRPGHPRRRGDPDRRHGNRQATQRRTRDLPADRWCSPVARTMRGWPPGRGPRPRCRTRSTPSCWAARCLGCCAPRFADLTAR